jgi:hypothetical protein
VKATLYVAGAFFELGGILMIAAPDLVPGALRLSRWANDQWQPIKNRVRRLLRVAPRVRTFTSTVSGGGQLSGRLSGIKGTSAETLEEKVAFLLRRDREAQSDVNDLRYAIKDLRADVTQMLDDLRNELKAYVAYELTASEAAYKTARIGGTVALAIGLLLATLGNFA